MSAGDHVTRRCRVCGRFRSYEPEDRHCFICGADALDQECTCGRSFEFALDESGPLHCPRCGKRLRGRADGFDD